MSNFKRTIKENFKKKKKKKQSDTRPMPNSLQLISLPVYKRSHVVSCITENVLDIFLIL